MTQALTLPQSVDKNTQPNFKILPFPDKIIKKIDKFSIQNWQDINRDVVEFAAGDIFHSFAHFSAPYTLEKLKVRAKWAKRFQLFNSNFVYKYELMAQYIRASGYLLLDPVTFFALLSACQYETDMKDFHCIFAPYTCTGKGKTQTIFPTKINSDSHFTYKTVYKGVEENGHVGFYEFFVF